MQEYSCCGSVFNIMVGSNLVYKILGPVCVCDGPFCGDQQFFITDPNGQHIQTPGGEARITKSEFTEVSVSRFTQPKHQSAATCLLPPSTFSSRTHF